MKTAKWRVIDDKSNIIRLHVISQQVRILLEKNWRGGTLSIFFFYIQYFLKTIISAEFCARHLWSMVTVTLWNWKTEDKPIRKNLELSVSSHSRYKSFTQSISRNWIFQFFILFHSLFFIFSLVSLPRAYFPLNEIAATIHKEKERGTETEKE